MKENTEHLPFILKFFGDFYCEILRQKEGILSQDFFRSSPLDRTVEVHALEKTFDAQAEEVIRTLCNVLREQSLQVSREGGAFAASCYEEVQYAMAVLADEIFLTLPWDGHVYWENNLIEERMFGTHVGGERFFNNLDLFLKERSTEHREIGMIYLTILGLGFRGRYRGFDDNQEIERYRRALFIFIYHQSPSLFQGDDFLFPQTESTTIKGSNSYRMSDRRLWSYFLLGVVGFYLLFSYGVWHVTTHSIQVKANTLLTEMRALS